MKCITLIAVILSGCSTTGTLISESPNVWLNVDSGRGPRVSYCSVVDGKPECVEPILRRNTSPKLPCEGLDAKRFNCEP